MPKTVGLSRGDNMISRPSRWLAKTLLAPLALTLAVWTSAHGATTQPAADNTASASTQPSAAAGDLTNLSLEDLMNVEVTSVAKEPQKISDAPASVTVIGQDDIQRSQLGSIPELAPPCARNGCSPGQCGSLGDQLARRQRRISPTTFSF